MIPGEMIIDDGEIALCVGRQRIEVTVINQGDRAIQVGSHYHFFEVNPALSFERLSTRGFRLDIPAGLTIRFEPGEKRTVSLVAYAGHRKVFGFRGLIMGSLD